MAGAGVPPQGSDGHSSRPTLMERIKFWDSQFSLARGLTLVTVLTGFLGGYFQYLNAYEEKVSAQAKADMTDATSTFVDISNAFAEALTLQNLVYFNFKEWLDITDTSEKELVNKAAHDAFPDYVKARTSLRERSSIFARKAELYIDWASDLGRDPAAKHELNADPLTEALLGNYNFDCDDPVNFPQFGTANTKKQADLPGKPKEEAKKDADPPGKFSKPVCAASDKKDAINLCARDKDGNIVLDKRKAPVSIEWQSAKHHVVTMHYCFEAAHSEMKAARVWASDQKASVSEDLIKHFREHSAAYKSNLDNEVTRLNAFMSLGMSQLERIRVKYRPSGFFCHLPLVRDAIGLFSERCTPVRTAVGREP
jgi:hypothetical protein